MTHCPHRQSSSQEAEAGSRIGAIALLLRLAVVVVAVVAVVAGCASRSGPTSTVGTTLLSQAEPSLTAPAETLQAGTGSEQAGEAELIVTREPWLFGTNEGLKITTPHYEILTTIRYENLVDHLPAFYESALEHYATALTELPMPRNPLQSYIFQTSNEWKAKTRQMLPDEYATFQHLGRGGFTTRGIAVLYYIDSFGRSQATLSIAAHEGWHQYSQVTFRNPLPIWLEEGIATYMESFRLSRQGKVAFEPSYNRERSAALREAARSGNLIDLDELLTHSPQTFLQKKGREALLTYYAQVWSLARFLAEGADGAYRQGLNELLTDAAEGRLTNRLLRSKALPSGHQRRAAVASRVGRAAILEYFNRDWAQFEDEYDTYVKELTRTATGWRGSGRRR